MGCLPLLLSATEHKPDEADAVAGSISAFAGRPPSRRPLTGVKVDGRDSRERAAQVGAISARALRLNTKANIWPPARGPTGGARQGQSVQGSPGAPGRVTKPPMSAPRVVGFGVGMPHGLFTADETPLDSPRAHPRDGEGIRSQHAPEDGQQPDDGGTPRPDDEAGAGGGGHASGGDAGAETGAGRTHAGRGSIDMWRGAGEDVWLEAGGGGHHADADKASIRELPGWLFYVPLVLISLEPARKGVWDALAFSRHAHAQLEGSWTASSFSHAVLAAPPENEPPQPHTARATPRSRDNSNSFLGDKLKMETPRRFADRLMGEQISNVQWRSSLRTNSNVVGLALALPHTPRQQAAKDSLRDPPASEQGLVLSKGRKLTQSISAVDTESNDYFPVCVVRQVPVWHALVQCAMCQVCRACAPSCPIGLCTGARDARMLCSSILSPQIVKHTRLCFLSCVGSTAFWRVPGMQGNSTNGASWCYMALLALFQSSSSPPPEPAALLTSMRD